MEKIILFIFLGISWQVNAQCEDVSHFWKESKVLDEFILRFNFNDSTYINNLLSNLKIEKDDLTVNREMFLRSIFDSCNDTLMNKDTILISHFIEIINKEAMLIDLLNKDNYALVKCTFKNNVGQGKNMDFDLVLQYIRENNEEHRWIVVSVGSPFLGKNMKSEWTINPANNDVDFMDLYRLCNDGGYMNLVAEKYHFDKLSMFISLLKSQTISLMAVKSVQYHFLQIDDYAFTVDYFNRNNCNAGWLISSLKRVENGKKNVYKENILYFDSNIK